MEKLKKKEKKPEVAQNWVITSRYMTMYLEIIKQLISTTFSRAFALQVC